MRRLQAAIIALVLCGFANAQAPVNGDVCKGADFTCTITKLPVTAGNTGVLFVASDSGSGVTFTVKDSTLDSIAPCGQAVSSPTFYGGTQGGNGGAMQAYLISFATTGQETITATASSQQVNVVGIVEQYHGALACDQSAGGIGNGTYAAALCRSCDRAHYMLATTAATRATHASELLVAGFFSYATYPPVAVPSFTPRQTENILSGFTGLLEDESVDTTGSYAAPANVQNNQEWMGLVVTLYAP